MNEHFFIYNNQFFASGKPVISSGNRSLRYGDGLFETLRMYNGSIINAGFHFDRLFKGMAIMQLEIPHLFTWEFLINKIDSLLKKNGHERNARIRLMVFREEGSILNPENNFPGYIIESWLLPDKIELNETGLVVDLFPDARKSCDLFSGIKSNNYLPYAMAGLFAKKNKFHDAIILNTFERVCESAIANLFIIKDAAIFTPPLSEGCVAGTMRRWMLEIFSFKEYVVAEKKISIDELLNADEIFLTNSIHPIRWVQNFREKFYDNKRIKEIYGYLISNM